jgi:hypothetical protein
MVSLSRRAGTLGPLHASLYPPDKRVQQRRSALHVLQLLPRASNIAHYTANGSEDSGSRLERRTPVRPANGTPSATKRIDKGLILKALGEKVS